MEIFNRKWGDHYFVMISMEQISKMFSSLCDNNTSGKGYIRTYIKRFLQKMLMSMIDTSYMRKENI